MQAMRVQDMKFGGTDSIFRMLMIISHRAGCGNKSDRDFGQNASTWCGISRRLHPNGWKTGKKP